MTSELIEFDRRRPSNGRSNDSKALELAPGSDPNRKPRAVQHILAPFDGSALAECTLPFVAAVAKAFSARVTLVRVLEKPADAAAPPVDALEWELARAEAYAGLIRLQRTLEEQGCVATAEIEQGRPAEQIAHLACRENVDLIVLSSHGAGGLHGWNLASTVHKVVVTTHASVLIIPAHRFQAAGPSAVSFNKLLVPLDVSQRAECILPAATEIARAHGAQLVLAHVVPEPEMVRRMPPNSDDLDLADELVRRNRREAEHYLRELQSRLAGGGVAVDVRLLASPRPAQALRDLARQEGADLIVLCAHGSSGDPNERYGTVAAKFLQEIDEPVIVLQDFAAIVQPRAISDTVGPERAGH